jgi:hypothetical protein
VEAKVNVGLVGVIAEEFGVDLKSGELGDGPGRAGRDCRKMRGERAGGVGAVGVAAAAYGHGEQVAAGVAHAREHVVDRGDLSVARASALLTRGDGEAERLVAALPGAFEPFEPFELGVDLGFVEDQRVA